MTEQRRGENDQSWSDQVTEQRDRALTMRHYNLRDSIHKK